MDIAKDGIKDGRVKVLKVWLHYCSPSFKIEASNEPTQALGLMATLRTRYQISWVYGPLTMCAITMEIT